MAPPQVMEDDPSIPNAAALWRRISPRWWIFDANRGCHRVTSQAFQNQVNSNCMSVYVAADLPGHGILLDGFDGYGLVELTAGLCREHNQGVVRAPAEGPPGHAHVVGNKPQGTREKLAKAARLVVEPRPA